MFREIRTSEKITDRFVEKKFNEFDPDKRIVPKTNITMEECDKFWRQESERIAAESTFDPDKRIVVG